MRVYLVLNLFSLSCWLISFLYRMPPDRGLSTGSAHGLKSKKNRLTLALTVNADGSEALEPLFIGHASKPRCFERQSGADREVIYFYNKKAWMNHFIFHQYLLDLNNTFASQNRKVLLWVDNFAGHTIPDKGLTHV